MFAVNFYASCSVSSEIQLGKSLLRLDWEKAIYRSLFILANTLKPLFMQANTLKG